MTRTLVNQAYEEYNKKYANYLAQVNEMGTAIAEWAGEAKQTQEKVSKWKGENSALPYEQCPYKKEITQSFKEKALKYTEFTKIRDDLIKIHDLFQKAISQSEGSPEFAGKAAEVGALMNLAKTRADELKKPMGTLGQVESGYYADGGLFTGLRRGFNWAFGYTDLYQEKQKILQKGSVKEEKGVESPSKTDTPPPTEEKKETESPFKTETTPPNGAKAPKPDHSGEESRTNRK